VANLGIFRTFNVLGFSRPAHNLSSQKMALESKPLFHPEVIRQQVRSFSLPEQLAQWQPKIHHWAGLIASGRADDFKETALLPDFLTDIFCGLLGYAGPAGAADTFTFSRERHVEVDGEVADAVLGRFQKDKEEFLAVLEGKGSRDPLDRPFGGRRMSAVDQAYRYAITEIDLMWKTAPPRMPIPPPLLSPIYGAETRKGTFRLANPE
jgi:hypothetical protein